MMKVYGINNSYNMSFSSRVGRKRTFDKFLENRPITNKNEILPITFALSSIGSIIRGHVNSTDLKQLFKEEGISYFEHNLDKTVISTRKNNGIYEFTSPIEVEDIVAKTLLYNELKGSLPIILGGLRNLKYMTDSLGRYDIVKKGLKIHSNSLNTKISNQTCEMASKYMSKKSGIKIHSKDLFMIENDIFYYDENEKTAYYITLRSNEYDPFYKPVMYKCKFHIGKDKKVIGYTNSELDFNQNRFIEKTYIEQQEPSYELPEYANFYNFKEFAEANRFGNSKPNIRARKAIPKILEHIRTKYGIPNAKTEDLQFVKYTKGRDLNFYQINYYDPSTGRSLVYDEKGEYKHQIEYQKDAFGNITASINW